MEHVLVRTDPYGDSLCERKDCLMCLTAEKDRRQCRKTNLVYKIDCKHCKEKGKTSQYWGETARNGYLRSSEHRRDLKSLNGKGHMETHINEHHPEIDLRDPNNRLAETHFTMKLHKRYKTPMDRQLGEAICIQRAGGMGSANVMNSKDE